MARPIELVPLVCVRCAARLPARPEEVAWVCAQCGQGQQLDQQKGLLPLDIHYAPGVAAAKKGKPFWVAEGQVSLTRQTYSGNQDRDAQQFWGVARKFFIPAFELPLEQLLTLGRQYLLQPPLLSAGTLVAFEPVTLAPQDVPALAEFTVMALEAERKDKLKELRIALELQPPVLWVLP
ncbi:MAG: hypothetical protein ACOYYS_19130 [Chloroflexota bacterium]